LGEGVGGEVRIEEKKKTLYCSNYLISRI